MSNTQKAQHPTKKKTINPKKQNETNENLTKNDTK